MITDDTPGIIVRRIQSQRAQKELSEFDTEQHGDTAWNVFYVIAPDGLCYRFGERSA